MPRKARQLFPQQYYHIISRGNNNIFLFQGDDDFQYYCDLAKQYFTDREVKCFHYILMNTHVHFLIKTPDHVELVPEMMKGMHVKYTFYYKKKYGFKGNLWSNRYYSKLIESDRNMLGCGLYIEHNPARAGMVKYPEEYLWSSYRHWVGIMKDEL